MNQPYPLWLSDIIKSHMPFQNTFEHNYNWSNVIHKHAILPRLSDKSKFIIQNPLNPPWKLLHILRVNEIPVTDNSLVLVSVKSNDDMDKEVIIDFKSLQTIQGARIKWELFVKRTTAPSSTIATSLLFKRPLKSNNPSKQVNQQNSNIIKENHDQTEEKIKNNKGT